MTKLAEISTLVDKATLAAFLKANPDPEKVKELRKSNADADAEIKRINEVIAALKKFSYDKHKDFRKEDVLNGLWARADSKNLGQYFDFLRDVGKWQPGDLYDTYLAKGSKECIPLPRAMSATLQKAIDEDRPLDMKPVRAYVVTAVDKRIVPKLAPGLIKYHNTNLTAVKRIKAYALKELKEMGLKP